MMASGVTQVAVRYVRPEPEGETRLRAVVAELQATSILRAAGIGGRPAGTCGEEKAPTLARRLYGGEEAGASGEEGGQ